MIEVKYEDLTGDKIADIIQTLIEMNKENNDSSKDKA